MKITYALLRDLGFRMDEAEHFEDYFPRGLKVEGEPKPATVRRLSEALDVYRFAEMVLDGSVWATRSVNVTQLRAGQMALSESRSRLWLFLDGHRDSHALRRVHMRVSRAVAKDLWPLLSNPSNLLPEYRS